MTESSRPPAGNGTGRSRFPVRPLAILLMVAGVASFVFARLVYGDQVLCLLGSTLVTFVGLAVLVVARRTRGDEPARGASSYEQPRPQRQGRGPLFGSNVPPGLRPSARAQAPSQPPLRTVIEVPPTVPPDARIPVDSETLLDEVIAVMEGQGAQVEVETQRESVTGSRGILRVSAQDGQSYSVLVREGTGEVDVADVRALFALVNSSGSDGGFLVASAPFTQRAYDWASARKIRLVREDELEEISI